MIHLLGAEKGNAMIALVQSYRALVTALKFCQQTVNAII